MTRVAISVNPLDRAQLPSHRVILAVAEIEAIRKRHSRTLAADLVGNARDPIEAIADRTGLSESAVKEHLKGLRARGVIRQRPRHRGSTWTLTPRGRRVEELLR